MDDIQQAVEQAVNSVFEGKASSIREAYKQLQNFKVGDILVELLLFVEDLTSGQDWDELLAPSRFPEGLEIRPIVDAVYARDLNKVIETTKSQNEGELLVNLFVLVVYLKAAYMEVKLKDLDDSQ